MAFDLVEIRGRFTEGGVNAHGYVTFRRSASLQDPATNVISPNDERKVTLDSTGSISIDLEATDSSGVVPANTTYTVTEIIRNKGRRTYSIAVPAASSGTGIELADVAPVSPGPVVLTYALQATLDAEVSRAEAAEADLQGQIDALPDTFLELTDTPAAYTGHAGEAAIVNPAGTALIFGTVSGGGASLSDNIPLIESGTGSAGVGTEASRDDHVHPAQDLSGYATTGALSTEVTNRTNADLSLESDIDSAIVNHSAALDPHPGYATDSDLATHSALTTTAHGGIVASTDARLTDARTPTAHATSHVTGGSDVIANAVAAGNSGLMSGADKTKLNGIATGATANSSDATLLARANHTGTQAASTISDFSEAVDDRVAALMVAGTNITLTYDDTANTLTVAAAGGSSAPTFLQIYKWGID